MSLRSRVVSSFVVAKLTCSEFLVCFSQVWFGIHGGQRKDERYKCHRWHSNKWCRQYHVSQKYNLLGTAEHTGYSSTRLLDSTVGKSRTHAELNGSVVTENEGRRQQAQETRDKMRRDDMVSTVPVFMKVGVFTRSGLRKPVQPVTCTASTLHELPYKQLSFP